MERHNCEARPDWAAKITQLGLTFNNVPIEDGSVVPYWIDDAFYQFSQQAIQDIKMATAELHRIALVCVDTACRHDELLELLHIPRQYWAYIRSSWSDQNAPSLYGRFDLRVDPSLADPPKMYEYNADTPTILIESSIVQADWFLEKFDERDGALQFNEIHDKLVTRWAQIKEATQKEGLEAICHFSCVAQHEEDASTLEYLAQTAEEAGFEVRLMRMSDIGWHESSRTFVDLSDQPIRTWFKLYPWELLIRERFGAFMMESGAPVTLEPVWKMILSNKAVLPLLWSLNPGHPNLLPSFHNKLEAQRYIGSGNYVSKPIFGREGANVTILHGDEIIDSSAGCYGNEPMIYQESCMPPQFGAYHAVVGSWVIGNEPAGICVREDHSPITKNISRFVPHIYQ